MAEIAKATVTVEADTTRAQAEIAATTARIQELQAAEQAAADAAGRRAAGRNDLSGGRTKFAEDPAIEAQKKNFEAASKFAAGLGNEVDTKATPSMTRITQAASGLRSVLSKVAIPVAFISAALGVVDLIEKWRTKGEAFRATLDNIARGFERTAQASAAAGRGGLLGDNLRGVANQTQDAMRAIQSAADAQLKDKSRVLWSLIGLDLTTEEIQAETEKRLQAVAKTGEDMAKQAKAAEEKRRKETIEAERKTAEDVARNAEISALDGTARIRAERDRDTDALIEKRNKAEDAATIDAYNRAIAARDRQAQKEIEIYLDQKEAERQAAIDAKKKEIADLEKAADDEQRRISALAKSNADAIRQVFQSINREAQSVNNTSGLEVAVGQITQLLQAIEAKTGGPL